MSKLRENSLEMIRHEATMTLAHLDMGRSKSNAETRNLERSDRSVLASNFQDIGIKKRMKQFPPNYKSKEEFLRLDETSDEDENGHLENINEIDEESQDNYQGTYINNNVKGSRYGGK